MLMNEEEFSSCRSVSEVVNELLLSDACVIIITIAIVVVMTFYPR